MASSRVGHRSEGLRAGSLRLGASCLLLCACAAPTDIGRLPPGDGGIPDDGAITLQLSGPPSLLVHDQARFTVRAVDAHGIEVDPPPSLAWTSSDSTVASVASTGTVTGHRRGHASITVRAGSRSSTATLRVMARVRIELENVGTWGDILPLAVGDSLRLVARYVDVDGTSLDETASSTWVSSDPAGVSVSDAGLLVGVRAWSSAVITASTDDDLDSASVRVNDVIAGLPATLRLAHTARGAGQVTFLPSKGAPVSLSFGESVERPVLSGTLFMETEGFPTGQVAYQGLKRWMGTIRPDDHLSLYAVGGAAQMFLTAAWAGPVSAPPDSGLVRFVQSSAFGVVYLRPPDAPMSGVAELCYFDPHDVSDYYRRAQGDFDVILQEKSPSDVTGIGPEVARFHVTVAAGRAVTYVIIGDTPQTAGVLAFPDP